LSLRMRSLRFQRNPPFQTHHHLVCIDGLLLFLLVFKVCFNFCLHVQCNYWLGSPIHMYM
jgi:hypothetical protein